MLSLCVWSYGMWVCVLSLCMWSYCMWICVCVCVREEAGGGGTRIQNQKQEPHTKMWGKIPNPNRKVSYESYICLFRSNGLESQGCGSLKTQKRQGQAGGQHMHWQSTRLSEMRIDSVTSFMCGSNGPFLFKFWVCSAGGGRSMDCSGVRDKMP